MAARSGRNGSLARLRRALAAGGLALAAAPGATRAALELDPVLTGLDAPLFVTGAGDGSNRLFVVEQGGRVLVLAPGAPAPTLFLDLRDEVVSGGEQGLLGLAFHPRFPADGRLFASYTRRGDGASVVSEHLVQPLDPDRAIDDGRVVLVVPQPFANHNGGMIAFGPDGTLYVGLGDGGAGNDPGDRAQDPDELLGKLLRIDVDGLHPYAIPPDNPFAGATPGRDEIWALGLRNPWRFSFDRATGELWLGDVGQNAREEVDLVVRGGNYGWRVLEGTECTGLGPGSCSDPAYLPPEVDYASGGSPRCSVTGGYAYRGGIGTVAPGTYLFGDFCTGEIFRLSGGAPSLLLDAPVSLASFGEDEVGELYAVDLGGGVHRLVDPDAPCATASSPESLAVPVWGGTAAIAVAAPPGCAWSAGTDTPWLAVLSPLESSGYGFVRFVAEPAASTKARTGSVRAGARFVAVHQPHADADGDAIPDAAEPSAGRDPEVKDNDVFASARLFAAQQYRDLLFREGDAGGVAFWTSELELGRRTRGDVAEAFLDAPEYAGPGLPAARLYRAAFLRVADLAGLLFWTDRHRRGLPLAEIASHFASSREFLDRYGALDDAGFVAQLYRNALGREADPAGQAYWTAELESGRRTRGDVLLFFAESDEHRATSRPEIDVTLVYVGLLGRSPDAAGFEHWVGRLRAGEPRRALVDALLASDEYRARFLP